MQAKFCRENGLRISWPESPFESDPRCFGAVFEGQFPVVYFVRAQLLMPSSYHAGF
jgi:hypothetical protein